MFKIKKLAIISDIHGNYIALEQFLDDIKKYNVDYIIASGDLINEFPFGREVIKLIKDNNIIAVKGNREEYLINYDKYKYSWDNIQFRNARFMYDQLTKEDMDFVKQLPMTVSMDVEDLKVKVVHASPESIFEFIHEDDIELMEKYAKQIKEDILIFGHSHQRIWERKVFGKTFINAGCAGVSTLNPNYIEYSLLTINGSEATLEKRNIPMDIARLKKELSDSGLIEVEKTFVNLSFLGIIGDRKIIKSFFAKAKEKMIEEHRSMIKPDANGIYSTFRLFDDDIWIELTKEYEKYFVL
ncbi:MAG: metallophosphoesterase family protein [Clostridia bacterium]|nr:metallophosphoesterase family protein [Clostridia bacterium]